MLQAKPAFTRCMRVVEDSKMARFAAWIVIQKIGEFAVSLKDRNFVCDRLFQPSTLT